MTFSTDDLNDSSHLEDAPDETLKSVAHWYAVQVASSCEKKVKANLEQRVQTLDVADKILQVEIPQTPAVKFRQGNKPQSTEEKIFPGYVLIRMVLDDETWMIVKNTPNVINFVGAEQKRRYGRGRGHVTPVPLSAAEVERIFKQAQDQKPIVKIDMMPGDKIQVLSGPFKDFEGEVIEVSPERSKLKALLSIFGRDTPVELEFNQVQKQS